ncbi:unnamed protein product [Lasius platythorax]|uniref:Uncharacterized protein n=1 Tax=Lasius platythorax TaxID=488582 RepID=A0AAV2NKX8_9HYME
MRGRGGGDGAIKLENVVARKIESFREIFINYNIKLRSSRKKPNIGEIGPRCRSTTWRIIKFSSGGSEVEESMEKADNSRQK